MSKIKLPKLNKVIQTLIASDFLLQAGWGFAGPVFAIFLTRQIKGGGLQMVGFVAAIYWITKSIVQPFFAHFLDKTNGEKDDFIMLVIGMYAANLVPLGYIFASNAWHIYLLEFIRALAMACVIPSWSAIFTRHISQGTEAFSWSIESTGIGLGAGIAGALSGWIATIFGFKAIFLLVSFFGLFASTLLLAVGRGIYARDKHKKIPGFNKPFQDVL